MLCGESKHAALSWQALMQAACALMIATAGSDAGRHHVHARDPLAATEMIGLGDETVAVEAEAEVVSANEAAGTEMATASAATVGTAILRARASVGLTADPERTMQGTVQVDSVLLAQLEEI